MCFNIKQMDNGLLSQINMEAVNITLLSNNHIYKPNLINADD